MTRTLQIGLWRGFSFMTAVLTALPAGAQDLPDLHLNLQPRTTAEAARIGAITAPATDFSQPERFEDKPAGAATVRARSTADAFSDPSGNIGFEGRMTFNLGNALFTRNWVSAPASTVASDGLGPLLNASACQACHIKDGRGRPPLTPDEAPVGLFLRLSLPAALRDTVTGDSAEIAEWIATVPDLVYGAQLQTFSLPGIPAEARLQVDYTDVPVTLDDGKIVTLRRPDYRIEDPAYGPLSPDLMTSPRVAPQMIGLGLLESIPAADIIAQADPADANGDGISGRASIVLSAVHGAPMLGRFGHKAGMPSVKEQTAAAFSSDMGLSTLLHTAGSGDCTPTQTGCMTAIDGADAEGVEVSADSLELVSFYARNLGVPARRGVGDAQVLRGKRVFYDAGCTGCHTPKFVTGRDDDNSAQSFQLIWPYTDLLLHDMGDGLADHRPEGRASGSEWRTAPLWGIGLTEQVTGHASYLHDGRARTLLEAILWHGGEASVARNNVAALPEGDRDALIRYLESL